MNAALCDFSICGALEKHLLTCLLTYLLTYTVGLRLACPVFSLADLPFHIVWSKCCLSVCACMLNQVSLAYFTSRNHSGKKSMWIGILKPAGPHSWWDACSVAWLGCGMWYSCGLQWRHIARTRLVLMLLVSCVVQIGRCVLATSACSLVVINVSYQVNSHTQYTHIINQCLFVNGDENVDKKD